MYKALDSDEFAQMLAEYTFPGDALAQRLTTERCGAALSVGGGVGLYVHVPEPQVPKVPVDRFYYKIGYTRATPYENRLTVSREHWLEDVYHQRGKDESTHLVAHYVGQPIYIGDVITAHLEHSGEFSINGMRESWFLDAFGPLPPVEIFERGLNKLDAKRYTHYLYGPAYSILSATRCRHEYYLTDSCPGCDADEENRTGPWEGVTELDYV